MLIQLNDEQATPRFHAPSDFRLALAPACPLRIHATYAVTCATLWNVMMFRCSRSALAAELTPAASSCRSRSVPFGELAGDQCVTVLGRFVA